MALYSQSRGEGGAFQKLERGELPLSAFYPIFGQECSDPGNKQAYVEYLKSKGKPIPTIPDVTVDGKELFTFMMQEASKTDPIVVNAVRKLRESGRFKIAALTNNFQIQGAEDEATFGKPPLELVQLFHEYIESSVVGLRKPDPEIFRYACTKMGVEPKHAILLDDIGPNLKSAREVGLATIRVVVGNSVEAIKELESLTGISLLDLEKKPVITGSTMLYIAPNNDILESCTEISYLVVDDAKTLSRHQEIEIPEFKVVDQKMLNKHIHELFPKSESTSSHAQELSDEAYLQRHKKHEYLEKRMRNREKEYVRHQLYKRRMLDSASSTPSKAPPKGAAPLPRLKSAYILQPPERLAGNPHSHQSEGRKGTRKPQFRTMGATQGRRSLRLSMPFGYPIPVMRKRSFERSERLLGILKERGVAVSQ
ncbi:hypothetical protein SpCBS45565_g03955 [Spizellomyces sp. 'palustris']|nr:hypothetical protein SpCBS45565_g03955 [Spizellomyces sp. 'palustris']